MLLMRLVIVQLRNGSISKAIVPYLSGCRKGIIEASWNGSQELLLAIGKTAA